MSFSMSFSDEGNTLGRFAVGLRVGLRVRVKI